MTVMKTELLSISRPVATRMASWVEALVGRWRLLAGPSAPFLSAPLEQHVNNTRMRFLSSSQKIDFNVQVCKSKSLHCALVSPSLLFSTLRCALSLSPTAYLVLLSPYFMRILCFSSSLHCIRYDKWCICSISYL